MEGVVKWLRIARTKPIVRYRVYHKEMSVDDSCHPPIPATMKAALATGFGDIDEKIVVRQDWPTPTWSTKEPPEGMLLLRVLACALAPGDVRVLSGKTDYMQLPPGGQPYVIGSDTAGIVVAVGPQDDKFAIGDYVVARFDEPKPHGGVAEFRLVQAHLTEHCPPTIPPTMACGLPASAMAAKRIVRKYLHPGDNVLVIGGSGAVGTCVLQYCRLYGAGFLAAVSTQQKLCTELGADCVIDYRQTKWWTVPEFKDKFDVVFDLVNGENWVEGGMARTAVKRTGVYVALIPGVEMEVEVHGILDAVRLVLALVGRFLWSRINLLIPKWVAPEALKLEPGDLTELFQDVAQGRLRPILDPASPFPFTEDDVRAAMQLQKSKHAHGKVVIQIQN